MSEWLPSDKWCDVYLVCRGKIFGSHRLVLASASTFLKDCLLSCPLEETPVFIILPEFDTDMLLLVLYYVYNGEVIVQGSQMKMFLELINALQIFVDSQYLQKNSSLEENVGHQANVLNLDTPTFLYANDENKQFNNVKKDIISFNALNKIKYSRDNKYFAKTKQETYSNLLQPKGNGVPDIHFEFGDRQNQPFSSDFFIKTCLCGKNCGVASGVLAISNEHYQEATSLLSTNANDILRSMTLLKDSQITSKSEYMNLIDVQPKRHDETYHISKSVYESRTVDLTETKRYEMNNLEATKRKCKDFREKNVLHKNQIKIITSIEHNVTRINSKLLTNVPGNNSLPFAKIKVNETELRSKTKNTLNKVTIHNQVLQSPWSPILPYNFRPILRQDHEVELSEVFPNNDAFATQMRQNSSQYTCVECDKSFSQLRNFKYHMSVHRGTKEFAITCPVCGKYFNDRGYLSSHMKIHRNRKEYKCSLCPKSFNQRVAYNMHVRIHTGVKPHVCDDCGKAFSRKMLLKQHQRTHSGERPYACSYCDKRFADRSNMTLHLRLHTGIKPFVCNLCPKAFTKKHHLKSHLNFHTGDKPYSCPRCKLAFTQSSNMRTHYKKCIM